MQELSTSHKGGVVDIFNPCDAGGLILAGSDPETGKNHIVIVQITMF